MVVTMQLTRHQANLTQAEQSSILATSDSFNIICMFIESDVLYYKVYVKYDLNKIICLITTKNLNNDLVEYSYKAYHIDENNRREIEPYKQRLTGNQVDTLPKYIQRFAVVLN